MTLGTSVPLADRRVYTQDTVPQDTRNGILWVDTGSQGDPLKQYVADTGAWERVSVEAVTDYGSQARRYNDMGEHFRRQKVGSWSPDYLVRVLDESDTDAGIAAGDIGSSAVTVEDIDTAFSGGFAGRYPEYVATGNIGNDRAKYIVSHADWTGAMTDDLIDRDGRQVLDVGDETRINTLPPDTSEYYNAFDATDGHRENLDYSATTTSSVIKYRFDVCGQGDGMANRDDVQIAYDDWVSSGQGALARNVITLNQADGAWKSYYGELTIPAGSSQAFGPFIGPTDPDLWGGSDGEIFAMRFTAWDTAGVLQNYP